MTPKPPTLSICIATYRRAAFIGQTLNAILDALPPGVEVVVVDGASPDETQVIVESLACRFPALRYFREAENSGIDRDFDKAVAYACGDHCWLMSDDDLLVPGAIAKVLKLLQPTLDLLVVNAQIRNADLSVELNPRILKLREDMYYDVQSGDSFLSDVGDYLSFIGGVIIRRGLWIERRREPYFGTLFIHVGVIFQSPINRIRVVAEPLIIIRYGNAMWTSRGFEIWMFKWPALIWSFEWPSESAKASVISRCPWTQWRLLMMYRAIGAYHYKDYRKYFHGTERGGYLQMLMAVIPAKAANLLITLYWYLMKKEARPGIYDLARSKNASAFTRMIARRLDIPVV